MLKNKNIFVIGPSGIGTICIRELVNNGSKKIYIKSKSRSSTFKTKKRLEEEYDIDFIVIKKFEELKNLNIDIAFICSPTNLHLKHIKVCNKFNIKKIIVEKPTFWLNGINTKIVELFYKKNKNLYTNFPMIFYAKQLKQHFKIKTKNLKNLKFVYNTNGKNNFDKIAIDLLPHAFSFFIVFFGSQIDIKKIDISYIRSKLNIWSAKFSYNNLICEINFKQNTSKKSYLANFINNKLYLRKQTIKPKNNKLDVSILSENISKKIINPIELSIKNNLKKAIFNNRVNNISFDINILNLMIFFLNYKMKKK